MFYIRCDSSFEIGSGHVVRCLSLAQKLRGAGQSVEFYCADLAGSFHPLIQQKGYTVHLLPLLTEREDAEAVKRRLTVADAKIVVDVYRLGEEWERAFYSQHKILAIDDLANRKHLAHCILDFNYRSDGEAAYRYLAPPSCTKFLGPKFCLLRDEFLQSRTRHFEKTKKVLVFFGGTDPSNEVLKLIHAIEATAPAVYFEFLLSPGHKFREQLLALPSSPRFALNWNPSDLPALMAQSMLFLGSGGTVTWERMFMGLPGVVVTVADNQVPTSRDLANDGYHKYLGTKEQVNYHEVINTCLQALDDGQWLEQTSQKGRKLVRTLDVADLLRVLA